MNRAIGGCGGAGGVDGGSSSGGGGGGVGGGSWPCPSSWRRTSGVRESGPPAFLTKTYGIVNDSSTNSIISWGKFGNSFIIWDHLRFSTEILPNYFRHSNLSSFVYQLNNYGFRKIGVDHQWEYENPDFLAGKPHLLTKIKRRGQKNAATAARCRAKRTSLCDSMIRPEALRDEMNESKLEIEKLRREQADMEFHIMALEEEVKIIEKESKKLVVCLAKTCEFVAKKMREDQTEKENSDDDEARKKRKLDKLENNETNTKSAVPLSENQTAGSWTNESGSQVFDDHEMNANSDEKNSADYMFWKTILLDDDDDEAYEGEAGKEMANKQAKIALDLEDLIIKLDNRDDE